MTDYNQDSKSKDREGNYKQFSYGKVTIEFLFDLILNAPKKALYQSRSFEIELFNILF